MKTVLFIIKGYSLWVWYYLNKKYRNERKATADYRMAFCKECESFYKKSGRCSICGCVMIVKTKMYLDKTHRCPEKKW